MHIKDLYSLFLDSAGISTDSRKIMSGQIFFALKGEHFNGNQFAHKALELGASYAVIDESLNNKDQRLIHVSDVLNTLQELAHYHRKQLNCQVLAITGSNGKTTTKELTASILARKYSVYYTSGNLNNHIGVPVTLLEIKDAEIAIIEMGANHPGEIARLCQIADPDLGIITNIGKAHLEGFGSLEGVAKSKTELYDYLERKNGTVFINGTNDLLTSRLSGRDLRIVSYFIGQNLMCDGYAYDNSNFLRLELVFSTGKSWTVNTRLSGKYNLENVLAASGIGNFFQVPEEEIVSAIEHYNPGNNRSQYFDSGKNKLILDAYNANPTSMAEALKNFKDLKAENKMLILGDMAELGDFSGEEHQNVLENLVSYGFKKVYLSGKEFFRYRNKYPYSFFEDTPGLYEHLSANPVIDHFILLKSSRTGKLEILTEIL